MHQALYRKWRPQTFDDVFGQEHITSILKYETRNNKFSHAYLFCGSRGTGKTTCAKILAKAVNCESPVNGSPCNQCASCLAIDSGTATDVLEMDAASNNGVENIRDIRDEVVYSPSLLKYRVYIVDEVHMLSGSAFNALLKTLEEPPAHVVFILATTELHKLPATIISRCQRFDFRRISVPDIMARLDFIAKKEGIEAENDALRIIAKYAQGGMRDAISLFELCAGNNKKLTADTVTDTIGSSSSETVASLLCAVHEQNFDTIFETMDEIVRSSKDISVFWNDIMAFCRDMLVYKTTKRPEEYLDLTDSEKKLLGETASRFTKDTILYFLRLLNDSFYAMQKAGSAKRNIAEMALVRMGDETLDTSSDALVSRISKLEAQLAGVSVVPAHIMDKPAEKKSEHSPTQSNVSEDSKIIADTKPVSVPTGEKMIRGWSEICDKAASNDPSLLPFLKMSRGYLKGDGSGVIVRFQNDFAMNMFMISGLPNSFAAVISGAVKQEIPSHKIEYVVSTSAVEEDALDDLIQN